jgi:hypothetical protein
VSKIVNVPNISTKRYVPKIFRFSRVLHGRHFFVLLTGTYPIPEKNKKEVKKAVIKGERPDFGGP